jgi:hypothetical protein
MPEKRPPERGEPRGELEIILPNRSFRRSGGAPSGIRIFVAGRSGGRAYFTKPGPLAIIIAAVVLGALFITTLVIVLGVFLIWIPMVGVLLAALIISGLLRRDPRRSR